MPRLMSSTEFGQGAWNAAVMSIFMLPVLGFLVFMIASVTEQSVSESISAALAVFFVATCVVGFVLWQRSRRKGGTTLVDCGPHPMKWLFFACAACFAVGALLIRTEATSWSMMQSWPLLLLVVLFYSTMAFGRLQIVENGLWVYWGLARWDKISSYEWTDDSTLLLRSKGWMGRITRGAVRVPVEHRAAFENALRENCGVTA